ncbi:Ubiquitin-transferase HECT domain-containing protein [Phytophthora infestans]|uniref:E3 ubiquitin-protein ligase HACE1 n=1 Tax=Phytophthora infestans TaxID=4787 RepID=A0A8S9UJE3_PHYIN|nr:Ubiquitin-transferase HECT domain-containing protein [Phytophthora infestans]
MASTAPRRRRPNRKSKVKTDSSIALPPSPPITFQLVTAIRRNDLDAFSSLLQTPQLDVNRRTPQGDTPLVEICRYARLEMATRLLSVHGANVNVASSNRSANRVGLTPLIAACMALQPKLVALLLSQSQKKVNLLKSFGRVNAATVLLLFCVANGRTDEQNDTALLLLEQLLTYAKQQNQLEEILTAKPDKVNSLLHVAAGLGNWKALRMLRQRAEDFDVEFNARNAVEHSALHIVEMNAFQARSMQFCEPPRPDVEAGGKKNRGRNRRRQKQKKQEDKEEEEKDEVKEEQEQEQELEPSEADKQTFTRSRPDRAVEALEVTRTVMELAKNTGIGAIFSRKGDEGLRGLYIKSLVLAEVGLVSIVNEIAQMPDTQKEKAVYLDGFMYTVASVYPLSVKNAKEYQSLWRQALDKKSTQNTEATDDERVSVTDAATMELSRAGFNLILDGMFSYNSISKRVKVWTLILMHLLTPFATGSPLAADKRPVMDECSQLKFFERIIEKICRSGTKLAFCIFDRTDIEDDDSYDDEIEFHWLISLFELFLQFFAPYARTIRDEESKEPLGIIKSFQRAIKPVKQLWPLVNAALGIMDDTISTPQRFSLLLHLLQVLEQLEAAFTSNEDMALVKLFGVMNRFVKQEAKKKRFKMFVSEQSHLLHTIAATFPIPTSFTDKVIPLKNSVDVLIRSDPKVLGMDLYSFAAIPGLIRLEHKVDYLSMLAEERNGSVSVSISRASDANYVDFILQQILSTSTKNLKAEMNITLVNEPGVGAGVTREFFQIVQRCFFQPGSTGSSQSRTVLPAPHVQEIGAQWLQLARSQNSQDGNSSKKRNAKQSQPTQSGGFADLFPLFDYVDKQKRGVVGIAPRPVYISKQVMDAKRKAKSLSLSRKDMLVDPSEVDALKRVYLCIGRLMGLAIRNHQPLAVDFPLAFWKLMMRDGSVTWENYCESSAVFKRSLQFVLDHDFDAQSLDMRFEYTTQVVIVDEDASTKQKDESDVVAASTTSMEMELQDGMGNVEVTNANKAQYVLLRAQQFFFGHELMYYKKIRDGFNDTIVRSDLKLFRPEELQRLVRGEQTIDLQSLKRIVVYSRGALPSRGVVQRFWEVAEGFDQEYRSKLLTFWSGSPLPPIFGFDSTYRSMNADIACWYIDVDTRMQPSFCPMANTCDRRLILPDYPSSAMLREKLLVALDHGSVGYDRM